MGVALKNGTVHECARVALVSVTANILLVSIGNDISCELPLHACGEAAAASSAETGIEDSLDNVLGLHLCKHLAESLITVSAYVLIDVLGIDNAAVSESNTELLLVECSIIKSLYLIACNSLLIEELLDGVAVKEVLLDDAGDLINVYARVERALGVNDHDRTSFAETEASCLDYLHLLGESVGSKLILEGLDDLGRARRSTACTAADEYVSFIF